LLANSLLIGTIADGGKEYHGNSRLPTKSKQDIFAYPYEWKGQYLTACEEPVTHAFITEQSRPQAVKTAVNFYPFSSFRLIITQNKH
jgi:hypothetical protein